MATMSQMLFSMPTVMSAVSLKYYVEDFQFKRLGYPRVVIPKDEKNGYSVLAAIICDVCPKR